MSKRGKNADDGSQEPGDARSEIDRLASRHLRFGWWALLVFLSLGIVLELLHGVKVGWYLDDGDARTRRLMWTLAHAHGTLLALVHVAFAATIPYLEIRDLRWRQIASPCLSAATLLLPGGFFLGGIYVYSADPGLGIALVPVGGLLLLVAVALIARAVRR
jgi:hypothetical protein